MPDDTITTIRKRVDEVNVVFTVTDKRDHFVKDLKQNDFRVVDDNKPALSIRSFSRQTNLPLRVGLLIDASNSVRDRFKFEQEAAIEFLNQIIRPKYDKAFVIGFDTTPEVTQDFTDSPEQLSKGVRMLRAGGGTAMYDAIYFACRDKLMKEDNGVMATRRAIILLSDGEDNQSRVSREEAVEMAQTRRGHHLRHFHQYQRTEAARRQGAGALRGRDRRQGLLPLQDRGRSQRVHGDFGRAAQPVRRLLQARRFHCRRQVSQIEIIADNKKYHVRARKGYYAPRQ